MPIENAVSPIIVQNNFFLNILGIAMFILFLVLLGELSQLFVHKHNPYRLAGARTTTIHALFGLAVGAVAFILFTFVNKAIALSKVKGAFTIPKETIQLFTPPPGKF